MDAALPAADFKQQKILELQKLKANCKPDELQKLKTRCEILVRDCIASLLIQLSINDFKEVEGRKSSLIQNYNLKKNYHFISTSLVILLQNKFLDHNAQSSKYLI